MMPKDLEEHHRWPDRHDARATAATIGTPSTPQRIGDCRRSRRPSRCSAIELSNDEQEKLFRLDWPQSIDEASPA
jgi:hypothetical protein